MSRLDWLKDLTLDAVAKGNDVVVSADLVFRLLNLYEEAATVVNGDEEFNADGSSRIPALAAAVADLAELDE